MKQTRWLYGLIVVYVTAAFGWWTYLLVRDTREIDHLKRHLAETENVRARQDVVYLSLLQQFNKPKPLPFQAGEAVLWIDTTTLRQYVEQQFPKTSLRIQLHKDFDTAFRFEIQPKLLMEIEEHSQKKVRMFWGEASVFALLLIWSFWLIFSSLRQSVLLNRQQMNFLHSITHELKTPIASAKLMIQTLMKRKLEEAQQKDLLQKSLNDLNRLNDLMEKVLLSARLENHSYNYQMERFNFSALCLECFDTIRLLNGTNYTFQEHIQDDLVFSGDASTLESVVINLLENAVKYSPTGSVIEISLEQNDKSLVLKVSDQGNGIPDSEKKLIFKKFYRMGNEDTRTSQGTGLGLSIVGEVIRWHKASIRILDNHPKGSIFEIQFPIQA